MRHMRWSYDQLMHCPEDYLDVIGEESRREAQQARAARRGHK